MDNNNPQPASPARYDDEIDLIELFAALWKGRWIVVGVGLVCVLAALAYALTAPNVYKLEGTIAPPLPADIAAIQPPSAMADGNRYSIAGVETAQVFGMVKGYLHSNEVRLNVWADFHSINREQVLNDEEMQGLFLGFDGALKIDEPKNQNILSISMETKEVERDKAIINRLLTDVDHWVVAEFVNRMKRALAVQQEKLESDINQLRLTHDQRLQDDIKQLQEAYGLAKKLGIEKTPYAQLANIELKVVENPYLLGTTTLQSQIEAMKARQGDDAFVPGLRDLQERLDQIKMDILLIDEMNTQASSFILLKPVSNSVKPVQPKKPLIMVASVFIGGILGIFAVFALNLMGKIRERTAVNPA